MRDTQQYGIRLRLTLHLAVPSFPISWVSEGYLDGVFPLFGDLRRFWGRAVGIRGYFALLGRPASSRRTAEVRHQFVVSARFRSSLRHAALEVVTTVAHSPRHDVFMFGASLQWVDGTVRETVAGGLRLPGRASRRDLRERLTHSPLPHSFLVLRDGTWFVEPPLRASAEFGGLGVGAAETEENENNDGENERRRRRTQ